MAKKTTNNKESVLGFMLNENLQAEVQNVLNKNIITDEDIEKYRLSQDVSCSVDEFIGLMNKAFDTDVNGEELAVEAIKESTPRVAD